VNIDDIPIGGGKPKTFEELLEENLRKMGPSAQQTLAERPPAEEQKKEFLKRKSQKAPVAAPVKKYNYYVDNFEDTKKREVRANSQIPEKTGLIKTEEVSHPLSKQQSLDHTLVTPQQPLSVATNRAVSPLDSHNDRSVEMISKHNIKKRFLTRGSGTAGGKTGHQNPKEAPQKKGGPKK